ncbi:ribosomal protein S5 domain 2-type protein [Sordaria brevicollis]|uniref:Phosphomevalonate kinase n=1 Tax=Sordaria brevicollis TaxID=83679 RepID=A0AAE0PES0_SORBR|nr:ribosomal protein S5 domain 2-type protein [Sordaria brevicollis]
MALAVSAPGKVLLAGGYLVLDRNYTGLVFGLSARINVISQDIQASPGVHINEIIVRSPQFIKAEWRYGYHLADEDGGIKTIQLQGGAAASAKSNPFVETTLNYALTYITRRAAYGTTQTLKPVTLTILADNDYYSSPSNSAGKGSGSGNRFAGYSTTLEDAHKTGLGSSAALVTALTASLLSHYLDDSLFDLATDEGKRVLHNLAQAAHCAAQGKVGSGFDVAAAVYGSSLYRRFSPSILSSLPEAGKPSFSAKLFSVVNGKEAESQWDTEVVKDAVSLPKGVAVRMCDVDCGSQTVGMVKQVLAWRSSQPEAAKELWDELQRRNEMLASVLKEGKTEEIRPAVHAIRELVRKMGTESGVPIEPDSQKELLDALEENVEGVYSGVVPGAGGFDALALLVKDDEETTKRLEEFLKGWSEKKGGKVKLMEVSGEMEGARKENLLKYQGWI